MELIQDLPEDSDLVSKRLDLRFSALVSTGNVNDCLRQLSRDGDQAHDGGSLTDTGHGTSATMWHFDLANKDAQDLGRLESFDDSRNDYGGKYSRQEPC